MNDSVYLPNQGVQNISYPQIAAARDTTNIIHATSTHTYLVYTEWNYPITFGNITFKFILQKTSIC